MLEGLNNLLYNNIFLPYIHAVYIKIEENKKIKYILLIILIIFTNSIKW